MQAIAMTSQILQRHVGAMQNAPSYLLAIANAAEAPPSVEAAQVVEQPDSEAMRQDIMRALFADSMESEKPAPPRQAVATPLPVLPTSLVRPGACSAGFALTRLFCSRRRRRPKRRAASCARRTAAAASLRLPRPSRRFEKPEGQKPRVDIYYPPCEDTCCAVTACACTCPP
jgi:hypothetical protein